MTFLPILQRELRVALRKRSTFWVRIVAPLVALAIAGAILSMQFVATRSSEFGRIVFDAVTWLGFGGVIASGLFLTADCLSLEKREGTLGFLFLTDLRGYDIVFGKLMATSLRCFYAFLAVIPVLCLTLLTGGVTGLAFFKTTLALVNALLCSLAVGLFVSSLSREVQKAMNGTFLALLMLCAAGPVLDSTLTRLLHRPIPVSLGLVSPYQVFRLAGAWGPTQFWDALVATLMVTCLLFALACFFVTRTWQEKARGPASRLNQAYAWKYGSQTRRHKLRQKTIGQNPVLWLACRERWQSFALWAMVILAAFALIPVYRSKYPEAWTAWTYVLGLVSMALYLGVASHACRFNVDAGRYGLIELLLVSPLNEGQIVRGQIRALFRLFGPPILALLLLQLVPSVLSFTGLGGSTIMSNGIRVNGSAITPASVQAFSLFTSVAGAVATLANLVALCWFSLWMGMTSRTTTFATLKAICFVQIIPAMVIGFASGILLMVFIIPGLRGGTSGVASIGMYFPLIMAITGLVLTLIKDVAFITWSRKKLYSSFRKQATHGYDRPAFAVPPVIPVSPTAPPPIASR